MGRALLGPAGMDAPLQIGSARFFPMFFLIEQSTWVLWDGSEGLGRKKTKVLFGSEDSLAVVTAKNFSN